MVKVGVILEIIMDTWNVMIFFYMEELYVEYVIHFRRVCDTYMDFLKYVKSTILDQT